MGRARSWLWKMVAGGSALGIGAAAGTTAQGTMQDPQPIELAGGSRATTLDIEGKQVTVDARGDSLDDSTSAAATDTAGSDLSADTNQSADTSGTADTSGSSDT